MPRATLLTMETAQGILGYISQGVPPVTAARACGVSESTWHLWRARARGTVPAGTMAMLDPAHDLLYSEFMAEVDIAEQTFKALLYGALAKTAITKPAVFQSAKDVVAAIHQRFAEDRPQPATIGPQPVQVDVDVTVTLAVDESDTEERLAELLETNAILKDVLGMSADAPPIEHAEEETSGAKVR